jgi:hypothetical protein
MAPFADVDMDLLSPSEMAFVRELAARVTPDEVEDAVAG